MISEKMVKAITRQMNRELYSAYLYFGMAAYAASIGLKGFERWFISQAKEEQEHTLRFYDYVNSRGSRVYLQDIETPPQDFNSAVDIFEKTLAHEKVVTGLIHDLVKLAQAEGDKDTEVFLDWFVKEQVEEETTPARILNALKAEVGKDEKAGLVTIDGQLAKRK